MGRQAKAPVSVGQGLREARSLLRLGVDHAIDGVRFRLDVITGMDYQPLPWVRTLRADGVKRDSGSWSRLERIAGVIAGVEASTGVDIGANAGFFSIALAERGLNVVAVEPDPRFGRVIAYVARRANVDERVALLTLAIDEDSVDLVPAADAVLFLSVWHHIVMHAGLEAAASIVRQLWARSRVVLFFDTGQEEMGPEFCLPPMKPSPREWIHSYLSETCAESEVEWLGSHQAFDPSREPVMRELFVVRRKDS